MDPQSSRLSFESDLKSKLYDAAHTRLVEATRKHSAHVNREEERKESIVSVVREEEEDEKYVPLLVRLKSWLTFYVMLTPMFTLTFNTILSPAKSVLQEPIYPKDNIRVLFENEWSGVGYGCNRSRNESNLVHEEYECWLVDMQMKTKIRSLQSNRWNKLIHIFYCDLDDSKTRLNVFSNHTELSTCTTTWNLFSLPTFRLEYYSKVNPQFFNSSLAQDFPIYGQESMYIRAYAMDHSWIVFISLVLKIMSSYIAVRLMVTTYPLIWRNLKKTYTFKDLDLSAFIMGNPELVTVNFIDWVLNIGTTAIVTFKLAATADVSEWLLSSLYLTKMLWVHVFLMKTFGKSTAASVDTTTIFVLAYIVQIGLNMVFAHIGFMSRLFAYAIHCWPYHQENASSNKEFLVAYIIWIAGIGGIIVLYMVVKGRIKPRVAVLTRTNCLVDTLLQVAPQHIRGISFTWYASVVAKRSKRSASGKLRPYVCSKDSYMLPVWVLNCFMVKSVGLLSFDPASNSEKILLRLKLGILHQRVLFIIFTINYKHKLCEVEMPDTQDLTVLQEGCIPYARRQNLLQHLLSNSIYIGSLIRSPNESTSAYSSRTSSNTSNSVQTHLVPIHPHESQTFHAPITVQ